jgi:hypothetical protein
MITLILALASISDQSSTPPIDIHNWAINSYGPQITFDIKRNGKNIGSHEVTFEELGKKLLIEATTKIRVKFLFFNAFNFDYSSKEIWENGELTSLQSITNDDGNKSSVVLEYGQSILNVTNNGTTFSNNIKGALFTTNHWNPNVRMSNTVLNTITGKTNTVEISAVGKERVPTANGDREAMHHQYSGDLKDISTWYDEKSRWVGLSFKGNDGSTISYECSRCGDK